MKLYKYTTVLRAISNIHLGGVTLSSPKLDFNDLYDCRLVVSYSSKEEGFRMLRTAYEFSHYLDLFSHNQTLFNKSLVSEFKEELSLFWAKLKATKQFSVEPFMNRFIAICKSKLMPALPLSKKEFNKKIEEIFNTTKESAIISCFSKINDSVLMWAHYANSNKGVCVEYDVESPYFYEVNYDSKLPEFDLMTSLPVAIAEELLGEPCTSEAVFKGILKPFYIKALDWQYEQEVRCIYSANNIEDNIYIHPKLGRYVRPMPTPTAIYLGASVNISDNETKQLLSLAYLNNIPVYKTKPSDTEFKISIKEQVDTKKYKECLIIGYENSLDFLIKQIDKCIKNGDMLSLLLMSLFSITYCSNIFSGTKEEQFLLWCKKYLSKNGTSLNDEQLFMLKNQLFNYGEASFGMNKIKIDISESNPFLNFAFNEIDKNPNGETKYSIHSYVFSEDVKRGILKFKNDYSNQLSNLPTLNIENNNEKMFLLEELSKVHPYRK